MNELIFSDVILLLCKWLQNNLRGGPFLQEAKTELKKNVKLAPNFKTFGKKCDTFLNCSLIFWWEHCSCLSAQY